MAVLLERVVLEALRAAFLAGQTRRTGSVPANRVQGDVGGSALDPSVLGQQLQEARASVLVWRTPTMYSLHCQSPFLLERG